MADLTEQQIQTIRDEVGDQPDDAALNAIYQRADVEDEWDVVTVVLKRRMAELTRRPTKVTIPGEYSQDTGDNLKALKAQLARLGTPTPAASAAGPQVRIVLPDNPQPLR